MVWGQNVHNIWGLYLPPSSGTMLKLKKSGTSVLQQIYTFTGLSVMLVTALISRPSYDIRYILSYFRNVRVVYLPLMLYIYMHLLVT